MDKDWTVACSWPYPNIIPSRLHPHGKVTAEGHFTDIDLFHILITLLILCYTICAYINIWLYRRPTCSQRIRSNCAPATFFPFLLNARWAYCCSMGISVLYKLSSSLSSSSSSSSPFSPVTVLHPAPSPSGKEPGAVFTVPMPGLQSSQH